MAGESTCWGCAEVGNVTPNGVEPMMEVTPSCGEEGVQGRCWEVQDGEAGAISVRGEG